MPLSLPSEVLETRAATISRRAWAVTLCAPGPARSPARTKGASSRNNRHVCPGKPETRHPSQSPCHAASVPKHRAPVSGAGAGPGRNGKVKHGPEVNK